MSRIIGIDVGGTNTNAALIENGVLMATAKCLTDHQNLLDSTKRVLEKITSSNPSLKQGELSLHLSTTLTTNAIVEGRGRPAAALVVPGPGLNLSDLEFPGPVYSLAGAIDHRGRETAPLDLDQARRQLIQIRQSGVKTLAIVGKFATRNPAFELALEQLVREEFPDLSPVTLGHRLSGRLNFPRRVTTALLNASVSHIQAEFARVVRELANQHGIRNQISILKADGGTMQLAESLIRPVETILSGPAASVMGALALGSPDTRTAVTLDIGGTTTEISILVDGQPLEERDGAVIAGYRTLVPALFSRSLGLGGDSRISWSDGKLHIGPEREGPAYALGGPALTPTDAVIALGGAVLGDRHKALAELGRVGNLIGCDAMELAEQIVGAFCDQVVTVIREVCSYLNALPVYTVSAALTPRNLTPVKLIGMGGPAGYFIPKIATQMGLAWEVLPFAEAANAIGAAASKPTVAINLRADTALGKLVVAELDEMVAIRHPALFGLNDARELAVAKAGLYAVRTGAYPQLPEIEITDEEIFNVVKGFYTAGRIIAIKAQVRPGTRAVTIPRREKEVRTYE